MKALILIGFQVDLLPGGVLTVPGSEILAAGARRLMGSFELVVAARFWLPAHHISFAANHPWRQPGQTLVLKGHPTLLQPMYCVQGSFGAEFVPGFSQEDFDFVADMGAAEQAIPYSAFFDTGDQRNTGLATFLNAHRVTTISIIGIPEDIVQNTSKDAGLLGFMIEPLTLSE